MATVSSLTKDVRRTGGRIKSKLEWPSPDSNLNFRSKKGNNNQGDSDSDPTSFTSSMHDSTSTSTPSTDRYMEERTRRKKTLDKSNSKKRTGFWSFRASKSIPQPPSLSLPEVNSATTRHPSPVKVSDASTTRKSSQKISRSGSLRSLKIVRNKSRKSKGSTAQDLRSNRATFSSTLKDSKFSEPVESQVREKESDEILPVAKVCPYQHCSLHGHHRHHEPPVKRFSFLKRRSSKDQKGVNPKIPVAVDNPYSKKTEVKVTKKSSDVGGKIKKNEKEIKKDVDCSIEFYAKTRTEHVQSSSGLYDEDLADIVNAKNQKEVQNLQMDDQGGKNENSDRKKQGSINGNQMSMWRLIQRNMGSDLVAFGSELDQQVDNENQSCTVDDAVNQETENRKTFVIKIVREAIEKILLSEVHQSTPVGAFSEQDNSERDDHKKPNRGTNDTPDTREGKPDKWSYKKKAMLLKRFITELEKVKNFDPNNRRLLPLVPESEAETVSLRPQKIGDKKNSDDWMLDYAIQQAVCELSPSQKRKVGLLVKAFESVAPKLGDSKDSSLNNENGDYEDFDEKGIGEFDQKSNSKIDYEMKLEKEKYMKMWHMIYQHVVTDITSKVGSELLHDGDDEQEIKDQNVDKEFSPKDADMLIRQSVNEILLPEVQEDSSLDNKEVDGGETQTKFIPKNWNKLRTLRRSIKDLESFRKPKPEQEGGQVDLRRQMSREKTKAEQWMIDYAVQHIVTKLTPARKKRVSMLVEAFEAVIPLPET